MNDPNDSVAELTRWMQKIASKKLILYIEIGNNHDKDHQLVDKLAKTLTLQGAQVIVITEVSPEKMLITAQSDPLIIDDTGVQRLNIDDVENYVINEINSLHVLADTILVASSTTEGTITPSHLTEICDDIIISAKPDKKNIISIYSILKNTDPRTTAKINIYIDCSEPATSPKYKQNIEDLLTNTNDFKSIVFDIDTLIKTITPHIQHPESCKPA